MLPPGVSFVAVQWVDLRGRAKARLVPRSAWPATCAPGGGVAVHGGPGRELVAVPDPSTLLALPTRPDTAIAHATLYDGDRVAARDARAILARVQARAAERDLLLTAGLRPRFHLQRDATDDGPAPFGEPGDDDPRDDLGVLLRALPLLGTVVSAAESLDWQVGEIAHMQAPGHFAMVLLEADALRAADRFTVLRTLVADIASGHGVVATFGPGLRVRLSAVDARAFAGGLIDHAHALCALTTPAGHTETAVACGPGWVEYRGMDGRANPYLALAALIAAGIDGIDRALEADAAQSAPAPGEALDALQADAVLRDALGEDAVREFAAGALSPDLRSS